MAKLHLEEAQQQILDLSNSESEVFLGEPELSNTTIFSATALIQLGSRMLLLLSGGCWRQVVSIRAEWWASEPIGEHQSRVVSVGAEW